MSRTVVLRFVGDSRSLDKAFADLQRKSAAADSTIAAIGRNGKGLQSVGRALSHWVTVPVLGIGAASVYAATQFDDSITKIKALVGGIGMPFDALEKSIFKLSHETAKMPNELVQAFYFIASSGFQGAKALDILTQSAKASAAGLGDTQTVADAVTGIMSGYRDSMKKASEATDVLIATVRLGKAEPEQLAHEFGKVISPAANLGVNIREVGAAVASMTLVNLNAAESTTALRQLFQEIVKPSAQAKKEAHALGFSFDEIRKTIHEKGLLAGLKQLKESTHGNSEALLTLLPNVRASTGFLAMLGKNAKETDSVFAQLAKTTGDTQKAFATTTQSPGFKFRQLLADLATAGITLGNQLLPSVIKVTGWLSKMIGKWEDLSPATQKTIEKFALLAAATGPVLYGVGALMRGFSAIAKHPIITFLALLAEAFVYVYTTNKDFRKFIQGIPDDLKKVADFIKDHKTLFEGFGLAIGTIGTAFAAWRIVSRAGDQTGMSRDIKRIRREIELTLGPAGVLAAEMKVIRSGNGLGGFGPVGTGGAAGSAEAGAVAASRSTAILRSVTAITIVGSIALVGSKLLDNHMYGNLTDFQKNTLLPLLTRVRTQAIGANPSSQREVTDALGKAAPSKGLVQNVDVVKAYDFLKLYGAKTKEVQSALVQLAKDPAVVKALATRAAAAKKAIDAITKQAKNTAAKGGHDAGQSFTDNLTQMLTGGVPVAGAAGKKLAQGAASGAAQPTSPTWQSLGSYAAKGYSDGITANIGLSIASGVALVAQTTLAVANAQKSKSPSKVFAGLGKDAADGYGVGLHRGTKAAAAHAAKLAKEAAAAAAAAALSARRAAGGPLLSLAGNLAKGLDAGGFGVGPVELAATRLSKLIKAQFGDKNGKVPVAAKAAMANLGKLVSQSAEFRNGFITDLRGNSSFISKFGGAPASGKDISQYLRGRISAVKNFSKNLQALAKKGVPGSLLRDIANAGLDEGGQLAATLVRSPDLKNIIALQKQLDSVTRRAGDQAERAVYGGPVARSAAAAAAVAHGPVTVNVNAKTNANPKAIANEVIWILRTTGVI